MAPRVRVLSEQVSRKIAAGEVIDRPYSVVRELVDNAIDAAAATVEVHLEEGGTKSIRVVDDGAGMAREDLELCFLPHATSKIESEHDLEEVSSLGFRGEALSSIATVARLRITSAPDDSGSGNRLVVDGGRLVSLGHAPANQGTTVEVADLFYSLPARKRFLKRASAETRMSQTVLLEKALPFPDRAFRLFTDATMKLFLPADDLTGRVAAGYPDLGDRRMLHRIEGSGESFSFSVVTPGLDMVRRDRKRLQIYVNGRRVWEYGLVQAIEYAFSDYIPGGLIPSAFVFLEVDPHEVDFNIHPAKREVRIRNLRDIHARLTRTVKEYLKASLGRRSREGQPPISGPELWTAAEAARPPVGDRGPAVPGEARIGALGGAGAPGEAGTGGGSPDSRRLPGARPREAFDLTRRFQVPEVAPSSVRYLGQAMRLFLVGESEGGIYLVDQHAGHERLLYERLRSKPQVQNLLVPIEMNVSAEEDELLASRREELAAAGIVVERDENEGWRLLAVPAVEGVDAEGLAETLRELSAVSAELERDFYADLACKAAIKDGDIVDAETGERLMQEIFRLETPHCPHGRPLWLELSREQLFHLIGRTL
ncbi:MAG: DNA mismatch repair endonuclease MutL [Spirochaetia bacterium]